MDESGVPTMTEVSPAHPGSHDASSRALPPGYQGSGELSALAESQEATGWLPAPGRLARTIPVITFVLRRLLSGIVTLIGSSVILWLIYALLGGSQWWYTVTPYWVWLTEFIGGNLGVGWRGWTPNVPFTEILSGAIPYTIRLVFSAAGFALLLGVCFGILAALRRNTRFDYGVLFLGFVGLSSPSFAVAIIIRFWGAIAVNDFLANPVIPWWVVLFGSLLLGGIWSS
ncbi:MAG: hypothetical protein FWG25_00030, partial [Promicromonosporaceae bacterium]|nr:hypothetical protein [Promicromonosporaceae bacterium]